MTKYRQPPRLQSLCVFCGSQTGSDPVHVQAATRLGELMARRRITLVFGGGHIGLMGALAEAALAGGSRVVGVIPEHLTRVEAAFRDISELIVVESMHVRKRRMFDMADAFCVLPGGMGTMDETFEILTWKQLRLHNKPIVILNNQGYWTPWVNLVESIIHDGFASEDTGRLFTVVSDVGEVLAAADREMETAIGGEPQLF